MLLAMIKGWTRTGIGKSQGFLGLTVRDETVGDFNIMHMAFEPTPDEVALIVAGHHIIVSLMGIRPQPIRIGVDKDAP